MRIEIPQIEPGEFLTFSFAGQVVKLSNVSDEPGRPGLLEFVGPHFDVTVSEAPAPEPARVSGCFIPRFDGLPIDPKLYDDEGCFSLHFAGEDFGPFPNDAEPGEIANALMSSSKIQSAKVEATGEGCFSISDIVETPPTLCERFGPLAVVVCQCLAFIGLGILTLAFLTWLFEVAQLTK